MTNTGAIPNTVPRLPKMSGTTMCVNWLIVTRTPSASPERPSGARLKMSMSVTGWAHPMESPSMRETVASATGLVKSGTSRNEHAEMYSDVVNTASDPQRFTSAGSQMRTTKAAMPDMASTTPMADADSPASWQ